MKTLCVVPCGGKKIWDTSPGAGPTKACEVYIGPFSSICRRYARTFHPRGWVILSAKYGFLMPTDIVPGPYNVSFNRPSPDIITLDSLRQQVENQGFGSYEELVVLGGRSYLEICIGLFGETRIRAPLVGCKGIGYMMEKLKVAMDKETPLV